MFRVFIFGDEKHMLVLGRSRTSTNRGTGSSILIYYRRRRRDFWKAS